MKVKSGVRGAWLAPLVIMAWTGSGWGQAGFPGKEWIRKSPKDIGLNEAKLEEFKSIVGGRGCVVRDGYLVYSWGDYTKPHDVASAVKPFYSYLLLKAQEEGKLESLDEKVVDYQPSLADINAKLGYKDRGMTFRHLGFQTACLGYEEPPGTAYDYNDTTMGFFWDTLINKVYGTAWKDAERKIIAPRLTTPLQFQDGLPGVYRGGRGKTGRFAVSARDFCRFALLFLNAGRWRGKQVLKKELAVMAVADPLPLSIPRTKGKKAESVPEARSIGGGGNQCDHNGGYSWMWWLNKKARDGQLWFKDVPTDFYACFGHGGQEGMAVLPTQRIIVSWIGKRVHQDRERGNRAFTALVDAAERPFSMDWNNHAESVVDLSCFLDAPAGKDGFLRVKGKHLVEPDGSRFRIWGVNVCGPDCFPSKEEARALAGDLARLGVNCVRFHHLDSSWGRSIFDRERNDTRGLDRENLDRFDYLVSELKGRGIYSNLNLNVLRKFKAGDGVRDYKILGIGKSATYFNPRLVELQHEFARQLLSHRNRYTGNRYAEEPAVAVVEIVNENSVLEGWVGWRLVGRDDKAGDTWSPIPVSYAKELTDQYNTWLSKNLSVTQLENLRREAGVAAGAPMPRLKPDQFAQASRERFHAEARFYMDLESTFFQGMKRLLKEDIGVKSIVVGTADHNDSVSGYPHISANLLFDLVDGHGYWEHPRIGKVTWIKNTPMVNDPLDSTVTQFARTPVVGRPFTISETNHPYPHRYACEGIPILTAYGLFHDWDGIYWFTWGLGRKAKPEMGIQPWGWFDFSNDPIKVTQLAICGFMWNRKDVKPARETVVRAYSAEEIRESLRMDRWKERPFFTLGFARSTPLVHATRFTLEGKPADPYPAAAPADRIVSDTGQLKWLNASKERGLVVVKTERTEALIGHVADSDEHCRHLKVTTAVPFGALLLTSAEKVPIAKADTLFLLAASRSRNSGFAWGKDRQTVATWGKGPVVIEPMTGTVLLGGLKGVKGLTVQALSPVSKAISDEIPARASPKGWLVDIGDVPTVCGEYESSAKACEGFREKIGDVQ